MIFNACGWKVSDARRHVAPPLAEVFLDCRGEAHAAMARALEQTYPPLHVDAGQWDDAEVLVALPMYVGQLRHDGNAKALAHDLDNGLDGVELHLVARLHLSLAEYVLDQLAGPGMAVEADEGRPAQDVPRREMGLARHDQHHRPV